MNVISPLQGYVSFVITIQGRRFALPLAITFRPFGAEDRGERGSSKRNSLQFQKLISQVQILPPTLCLASLLFRNGPVVNVVFLSRDLYDRH